MVFALADYLRYRTRRGRYDPALLESQGWVRAIPENFKGPNARPPGTSFVMHTQGSALSWLIMYVQQHPAGHAALFAHDGDIVDATTGGTCKHPLADYLDGESYILVEPEHRHATAEKREEMLAWVYETQIERPYGWAQSAALGADRLFGSPHDQAHWQLWSDVMILFVVLSLPRRWINWWPDLVTRLGSRYMRTLILNRCRVRRPCAGLVEHFTDRIGARLVGVPQSPFKTDHSESEVAAEGLRNYLVDSIHKAGYRWIPGRGWMRQ